MRYKLIAYKGFLEDYPRTASMICLIQYLIPFDCLMCSDPECTHFAEPKDMQEV